jgi:hypothetical protein
VAKRQNHTLIQIIKDELSKMFGLPTLLPDDQLDFTAAKTKLERDCDQLMRTFKEHIDLEANY